MFGIEKLISKPLLKWIEKGGWDDLARFKTVMASYFLIHLISVILMSWMLYRILKQKKKDKWSLILPIGSVIISVFIPYSSGDVFIDAVAGIFSKAGTYTMILCFIGLIMAIGCIVLYFFDIKIGKSENGDGERKEENKEKYE